MQLQHVIRCAQCERLAPAADAEVVRIMVPDQTRAGRTPELVPSEDVFICGACAREMSGAAAGIAALAESMP